MEQDTLEVQQCLLSLKCPEIKITVVDYSPEKIKAWNGPIDKLPVYEPGLSEIVEKVRGEIYSSQIMSKTPYNRHR